MMNEATPFRRKFSIFASSLFPLHLPASEIQLFISQLLSPAYKIVEADFVKSCHEQKIKVLPWTVNTKEEITRLKDLGVDGVISDCPNLY